MKTCSRCKQDKNRELFHKKLAHKDGLSMWCKQCTTEHYKLKNPDRQRTAPRVSSMELVTDTNNVNIAEDLEMSLYAQAELYGYNIMFPITYGE